MKSQIMIKAWGIVGEEIKNVKIIGTKNSIKRLIKKVIFKYQERNFWKKSYTGTDKNGNKHYTADYEESLKYL